VKMKACDREKVNRAIISENRVVKECKICFVWTSYFPSNFEGRDFEDVGVHQRGAVIGEQSLLKYYERDIDRDGDGELEKAERETARN
jgi:hypothetical protein